MKNLALLVAFTLGLPAAAQEGVWTGYVNGWVPSARSSRAVVVPRLSPRDRTWLAVASLTSTQLALNAQVSRDRQAQVEAQRLAEFRAAELKAQNENLLAQQRVLAEQHAAWVAREEWRRADDERRAAEQRASAAASEAAQLRARLEAQQQEALNTREQEVRAREAARLEANRADQKSGVKGRPVVSWVDEDGVTHFTNRSR